jgi:hypothetical protein
MAKVAPEYHRKSVEYHMAVLNRGTTEQGKKRAVRRSASMKRTRAKASLPPSVIPPLEKDEEEVLARLKARRNAAVKGTPAP